MPSARRVSRATLASSIEAALRRDIVEGALPPGYRLTAAELTERYEVSATPLREALQRLAAENLVAIDPRLGATVARISRADLLDTYRVRSLLESLALEESVRRGGQEWEATVRGAFQEFETAVSLEKDASGNGMTSWASAHRAFHDSLLSASDSQWLKNLLNIVNVHSERYRLLAVQTGERDPIAEHVVIFRAALARDGDAAVDALRKHLDRTVEVIEGSLQLVDDVPRPSSSTR
jgi:GntR family carbon starvation induced transcriptional regulator